MINCLINKLDLDMGDANYYSSIVIVKRLHVSCVILISKLSQR